MARMIKGKRETKNFGAFEKFIFKLFSAKADPPWAKRKTLKKRFERFGNKIHSGHFENSRLHGELSASEKD